MNKVIVILILLIIIILITLIVLNTLKYNFNNKSNRSNRSKEYFTKYDGFEYSDKLSIEDIKNLKKGQKIMTNMLREFDRICRKHNLKYWCIGGTLIGALRHNGWVPWDGDVDIGMLEEDYIKFKNIVDNELSLDIEFSEPKDKPCSKLRSKKAKYIYTKWGNNWDQDKGIQIDIFIFKKNYEMSNIKGNSAICGTPDKNERDYNDMFPLKEVLFKGFKVYVPNKYEKISKELWGNYPPEMIPKEKRYPHEGKIDANKTCDFHYEKYPDLYKK